MNISDKIFLKKAKVAGLYWLCFYYTVTP